MLGTASTSTYLGITARVSVRSARPLAASSCGRMTPLTHAFANSCAESCPHPSGATYERILRYPDGRERRIIYPVPTEDAVMSASAPGDEWETRNAWKSARPRASAQRSRPTRTRPPEPATPQELSPSEKEQHEAPSFQSIPDSPLALLRYLTSDAHKEAQRRERAELQTSYEILKGCPWPVPRPLYVLAARQPRSEAGLTHTLRTRMPLSDVETELSLVLRGNNAPEDPLIRCSELVDGVVTFELENDAEQYGQLLEESGTAEGVAVVRCDSHELFRSVQSVKGVVVMLRAGLKKVPYPHQLAAAVRGPPSALSSMDADELDN